MVLSTATLGVGSVAASHAGSTVYVDASNTGAEDGSQANPFNTIQEGVNHASAGDTVLVAAGTYFDTVSVPGAVSGTRATALIEKPIVLQADGAVHLDGPTTTTGLNNVGVYVNAGGDGAEIRGFTITGFYVGVFVASGATDVVVAGNDVSGQVQTGNQAPIGIEAWSDRLTVEDNSFDDAGVFSVRLRSASDATFAGNTFQNSQAAGLVLSGVDSSVVSNNVFDGQTGDALRLGGSSNNLVEENEIRDAGTYGILLATTSQTNTVRGNEIRDAKYGLRLGSSATSNTIYDNYLANGANVWTGASRGGDSNADNTWYVSPQAGPNVVSGPQVGGNYWSNAAGTGFSDTAADADGDGFADAAYTADGVDDQYPLVLTPDEPPVVTASAGVTTYEAGTGPVVVDAGLSASDSDGGDIDGARVVIQNLQAGDTLDFVAQHGITGSYDASSGVLALSGTATAAQYQDVFRSVTFSNANANPDATDRRITFALGANIPFDGTGHYYEYVSAGGISWQDANSSASAKTYFGLQGYLVTVTSQAENDFVAGKLQGDGWIGASDDTAIPFISKDANGNDRWYWVTGPEAGTHFWTGDENEAVSQPVPGEYANWAPNEPNDFFGTDSENYAHFYFTSADWNDFPNSAGVAGYVVEYGGLASDPMLSLQDTKVVEVLVNTPPSVSVDASSVTVDEGSTATNTGAVSDDGSVSLTASVGTVVDNGDGTWSWSFATTDGPDDSQTVTVTATDSDGASSSVTFDLTVENVAPAVTASVSPASIDEGSATTLSASFTDPGVEDTHTATVDWGDGTTESVSVTQGAGSGSLSATHVYADDDAYTVVVTVADDDSGVGTATTTVDVSNVAPTLSADAADTGVEDTPLSVSGTFTDPGTADTHTVTVDWGDGTSSSATVTQGAGSGSFADSHAYATGGIYTLTVTVTDDDGGTDTYTETVTVAHHEEIEVKPDDDDPDGTDRNPINLRSGGVTPVAVLGSGEFDVRTIDVSTVRFGDPEDVDAGAGAAARLNGDFDDDRYEDVNGDGILDLVLHFDTKDLGFEDGDTVGKMVGLTESGVPFFGTDDVDAFLPGPGSGDADSDDADDGEDTDDENEDDDEDDDDRRGKGRGR